MAGDHFVAAGGEAAWEACAEMDCTGAISCLPHVGAIYLDGMVYLRIFSPRCNSCAAI